MLYLPSTPREIELYRWGLEQAGMVALANKAVWEPVSGDASFRSYFRLSVANRPSYILADLPPQQEDIELYLNIFIYLTDCNLRIPQVYAFDSDKGFLLLEDFGNQLLLHELADEDRAEHYYLNILDTINTFQHCQKLEALPSYTSVKLHDEMSLFWTWCVKDFLADELDQSSLKRIEKSWCALMDTLSKSALAQPQVLVHRDLHSRNIMCLDNGDLGYIDFQDLIFGPITYDIVSLLRDCYISWPEKNIEYWLLYDFKLKQAFGYEFSYQQYLTWFNQMGLQRHLKVLGIFCRLHLRDGKSAYLNDLPLVAQYSKNALSAEFQGEAFTLWFNNDLIPALERRLAQMAIQQK
jgi:aminoglycoside/choline kinase family phosphotransferase